MSVATYIKNPVEVQAIQYDGTAENQNEIIYWIEQNSDLQADPLYWINFDGWFFIETLEGRMRVGVGDYVIKGIKGEFYPCKPDIFIETYREKIIETEKTALYADGRQIGEIVTKPSEFFRHLEEFINGHSLENGSDTPDFILAGFLENVLTAWNQAVRAREKWYSR